MLVSPERGKEVFERLNFFIHSGHLYEAGTKELESQIQLVLEENLDFSYLKTSVLFIISDFLSHGKKS